ncbi:MAG: hypothetical protein ABI574_14975 [Burkholderiales bacterium]
MAGSSSSSSPRPTRLAAGQSQCLSLPSGSQLHVVRGRLRVVESPQWLAERIVMPQALLPAGAHFMMSHRGWVELHTDTGCELVWREPVATAPVAAWGLLWRWVRGLLRSPGAVFSSR